jgi:hypothetical protein
MYVSRTDPPRGVTRSERVSKIAEQVTREGRQVRLVRTIVVPEEETCFYLFQAQTAEVVREAATRAGLHFEHVVETFPEWGTDFMDTPTHSTPPTTEREQS